MVAYLFFHLTELDKQPLQCLLLLLRDVSVSANHQVDFVNRVLREKRGKQAIQPPVRLWGDDLIEEVRELLLHLPPSVSLHA